MSYQKLCYLPLIAFAALLTISSTFFDDDYHEAIVTSDIGPTPGNNAEEPSDNDYYVRVNRHDSRYFELSNGSTFIPIGPNLCFPRFETEEEKVFELYERQFRELHENGCNYTRVYLSAPFWEVEHERAGVYDPDIAVRLDRLLELAKKYEIKIKFCFEYFRSIEDLPPVFKHSITFGKPIYSVKYGGTLSSISEFLDSKAGHDLFISRVKFFSGRYGTNSQVFAWELWNEMNTIGTYNEQIKWTDTMLNVVHGLFPESLVVQSLGSFDDNKIRDFYSIITTMPRNDYAQIHRYLDPGADLEVCRGPMDVLTSDAVYELQKYITEKPVILAETGAVEFKHAGPSRLYESDKEGILLHDMLFAPFFSGSAGPGQSWHWSYYIDMNDLWWHYGRFSEAIKNFDPVNEKVVSVRLDQQHFRIYALKGQHTVLIWIRDANSNWKTELIEKIPTSVNHEVVFDSWPLLVKENAVVSLYDPWTNKWTNSKVVNGKIALPDFNRSLVIKIEI